MLEGIADYDDAGRFGIPKTDLEITRMEAAESGRPDYEGPLFGPDGVARERARLRRALGVIRAHPLWFLGVMARRGAAMLRLERARLVSAEPPVTHELPHAGRYEESLAPAWLVGPRGLSEGGVARPQAKVSFDPAGEGAGEEGVLRIEGDGSRYGEQFATAPVAVAAGTDYLLSVRVKPLRGRMRIGAAGEEGGDVFASTLAEKSEGHSPERQPWTDVLLPFVSRSRGRARVVFLNEGPSPVMLVAGARLDALGPSSNLWTRYPRLLVRAAQRCFLTATILPLAAAGFVVLALRRRRRSLLMLLVIPAYFLCVQSAVHTEYRYVLSIYHFLFALSAVALSAAAGWLRLRLTAGAKSGISRGA